MYLLPTPLPTPLILRSFANMASILDRHNNQSDHETAKVIRLAYYDNEKGSNLN